MNDPLQVYEHGVLRIEANGLTQPAFDALVRFNQGHQDRFFAVRHRSLKFGSYVGVLQVGGVTIEVLPKPDRNGSKEKKKWRAALIDMLRVCGYLRLAAASAAHLALRRGSLFDLYMEAFLSQVRSLVYHGLVRKYRCATGNLTVLRGRLLFGRNAAENAVHRERFFTVHERYDRNNQFNQILHSAVRIVSTSARSSTVRGMADDLLLWMEDIEDRPVSAETFSHLRFDRNTERYRSAMALARMIILNFQPDVRSGRNHVLAILFDMNELFEEYILRKLQKATYGQSIKVQGQHSQRFWHAGSTARNIRPDILITIPSASGPETLVLDTKWKVPAGAFPDDEDLRQVYAYNLQCNATRGVLVYPRVDKRPDVKGYFEPSAHAQANHSCAMWFVDLFDGDKLRRDIGLVMLRELLPAGLSPLAG